MLKNLPSGCTDPIISVTPSMVGYASVSGTDSDAIAVRLRRRIMYGRIAAVADRVILRVWTGRITNDTDTDTDTDNDITTVPFRLFLLSWNVGKGGRWNWHVRYEGTESVNRTVRNCTVSWVITYPKEFVVLFMQSGNGFKNRKRNHEYEQLFIFSYCQHCRYFKMKSMLHWSATDYENTLYVSNDRQRIILRGTWYGTYNHTRMKARSEWHNGSRASQAQISVVRLKIATVSMTSGKRVRVTL